MQNIKVNRYANPRAVGWAGWLEPEDRSWIAYIGLDGKPLVFLNRDPVTGGILPDDPVEAAAHLKVLRGETEEDVGLRIGMKNDGSAIYEPEYRCPHELGEVIHPLGTSGGGGDVIPLPSLSPPSAPGTKPD